MLVPTYHKTCVPIQFLIGMFNSSKLGIKLIMTNGQSKKCFQEIKHSDKGRGTELTAITNNEWCTRKGSEPQT